MLETKLSPAAGLLDDLFKGQTFMGEELPPTSSKGVLRQMYERMAPLAVQGIVDATVQDGMLGTTVGAFEILGIGSITYSDEVKLTRNKVAQQQYGIDWDEVGQTYGRAAQMRLEQSSTAIQDAEKEYEKRFVTETPTLMQQWQNEGKGVEDTYRDLVDKATREFRATGDGVQFREKINQANVTRRQMYASRSQRNEYKDIVDYYNQPLKPEVTAQMNPLDLARREYYQQVFGLDMYDKYGNYDFDLAEQREADFARTHGQSVMDYIEEYQGSRWVDRPTELKTLEQARVALQPYWNIVDQVWSMYPPELKALSDQIQLMERTNPEMARQMLKKYPAILRSRELIAQYKAQMRKVNPMVSRAYNLFYRY